MSEGFDILAELALNLRWSWNHATDGIWRRLEPDIWDLTQNPWIVLQTASPANVDRLLADKDFRAEVDGLVQARREALNNPAWFQQNFADGPLTCAAYFSMEFMLSEALPIYSGGLGNVAGDQLKAASDLGVPVVGVGLLYQQGYFRQTLDRDGGQQALYPYNDPGQLPISPVRRADGEVLRIRVEHSGTSVSLRVWQVCVGRTTLYLLDTNDATNYPAHRGITSELYGGGPELRLLQEILLGVGGWKLLVELGLKPEVCHLNEGHAAFAVLERARSFMVETGCTFEVAMAVTRAGNLFTTHTAVAAGFDLFAPELIERYLGGYAERGLGVSVSDLLAFGRRNGADNSEKFNMAYLAIRGSGRVNGVSRLHGEVSRSIFSPLFPRWPEQEVPVGHVTNGIHVPTWDSSESDALWTEACGKARWLGTCDTLEADVLAVPDEKLWQLRTDSSKTLVDFARGRLTRDLAAAGAPTEAIEAAGHIFSPDALTLGFARRFATYKRPDLLLRDPERLLRLLANPERPVQLLIAGKAHPADVAGQELIRRWVQFARRPDARPHVAFLSDYDMLLTQHLVQGVDVWINTPRRPWEASGTSGMKVLVNGGINLSELDGWWAEAYTPEVGWALGDGEEHGDDPAWDAAEAEQLYRLLEEEVVPEFCSRSESGVPTKWVGRMRASMAGLTPRFSADRTVREYTGEHYVPAAAAYAARSANSGQLGQQVCQWRSTLEQHWASIRFGSVNAQTVGDEHRFRAEVHLGDLDPAFVVVEMYADGVLGGPPVKRGMARFAEPEATPGDFVYQTSVSNDVPAEAYTARVVPYFADAAVPLECGRVLWQR
jgi:starch phosphorylase